MHIDKYKENKYDIRYTDPSGCVWDDEVSFIQGYLLGFCCCGSPEDNLNLVREGLELTRKFHEERETMPFEEYQKVGIKTFGSEVSWSFFLYWTETKDLTEHGSSIGGSWLSDAGKELLEDLNEMHTAGYLTND